MGRSRRNVFLAVTLAALTTHSVAAQTSSADETTMPRFVGAVSIGLLTDDANDRMRLGDVPRSWATAIDFAAAVSGRVAVGMEVGFPPTISTSTGGVSFRSSGTQSERTLVGFVRARVAATRRTAIDVMAGAGLLYQHHALSSAPCYTCADTYEDSETRWPPVVAFGADVPYRVAPHLWVSWFGRWYALKREEHKNRQPADSLPWQYEWGPSTRASVGVSARVGW